MNKNLFRLIEKGKLKKIQEALMRVDVNQPHPCFGYLLHKAVLSEQIEIAEVLLEAGANPNLQDEDGYTSLHLIQFIDFQIPMMRLLLEHGADSRIQDHDGESPWMSASDKIKDSLWSMNLIRYRT